MLVKIFIQTDFTSPYLGEKPHFQWKLSSNQQTLPLKEPPCCKLFWSQVFCWCAGWIISGLVSSGNQQLYTGNKYLFVWRGFFIVREKYIYIFFFSPKLGFSYENFILVLVLLHLLGNIGNLLIVFFRPIPKPHHNLEFREFAGWPMLTSISVAHIFTISAFCYWKDSPDKLCKKFWIPSVLFFQRQQTITIQQNLHTCNYFQ